ILLVVAAPMIWGEMARLYAIAANDRDRPLCDELLVATLLGSGRAGRREIAAELEPRAPLLRHGLVNLAYARRPFGALTVHPIVVRRLYGETFEGDEADGAIHPRDATLPLEDLIVAPRGLAP